MQVQQKIIRENEDFKIDAISCLSSLEKIENGDRSELIEIGDIDKYIENLKKQVEDDVAGSFKKYAKSYIPTSQAVKQAWNDKKFKD